MSFAELQIEPEYRSLTTDVAKNFYIPVLKEAILYQRAVGFFASSVLAQISEGVECLAEHGGKIQLIASPHLQEQDVEAIEKGYQKRDKEAVQKVVRDALFRELNAPANDTEARHLDLLVNLIAYGCLDIKIAMVKSKSAMGMYHEKMGIMEDIEGNQIAFSGSMNESGNSLVNNYEAIDVFCSWKNDFDRKRASAKSDAFRRIWNNEEQQMEVLSFPDIKEEMIQKYRLTKRNPRKPKKVVTEDIGVTQFVSPPTPEPKIPETVHMRDYQNRAYENWANQNYCGIIDMATGTGKTYTALAAICKLYEKLGKDLVVIIVCPYQHLVEQWKTDIEAFGMKPIVCYSASEQKDWKKRLKHRVNWYQFGSTHHFCMVTTNATFSTEYVQDLLKRLKGNTLLVVDEAHNLGSENLQCALLPNMKYRLALSATIERHGDEEGTQALFAYFGEKCIEYTLEDAIRNEMLTPYYYYPIVVTLNEDELAVYTELTRKIGQMIAASPKKHGKVKLSEAAKSILIKRARLVAAASGKIEALREAIEDYRDKNHMLVYCGSASMKDNDYVEGKPSADEMRQIDVVTNLLGNQMGINVAQFTSRESAQKRKQLISSFDEGVSIQALIAIRCLDEGVNIPSVDKAFILASSTNPKEYVQRRGRVLRLYKGKKFAKIYDFITLPIALDDVSSYAEEDIATARSLVKRELARMIDFAKIAENPFEVDSLIYEIKNVYNIKEENLEDEWDE